MPHSAPSGSRTCISQEKCKPPPLDLEIIGYFSLETSLLYMLVALLGSLINLVYIM
ncbi:hypothetical protein HanPI659440_Chr07g0263921 [Helianthus annuus]|nr:hypothetical protein HanPI659440_Chr07g0263921 [Helianthus annuus]